MYIFWLGLKLHQLCSLFRAIEVIMEVQARMSPSLVVLAQLNPVSFNIGPKDSVEREKKKKKEWWEEENVLSDEEDLDDIGEKQPLYEAEGELLEF